MLRRPGLICSMVLASLLLHAAAAYGAPGDPEAGSPSGGVYELPLESGRADAAPGSGGGGTTAPEAGGGNGAEGGSGSGETGGGGGEVTSGDEGESGDSSYYRSENNFGSSSQVPGTDGGAGGTGSAGGGSGSASDSGGDAGGKSAVGLDPASAEVPDTGNTSVAGNVALLAVIVALAALVGVFVARRRRLRTR